MHVIDAWHHKNSYITHKHLHSFWTLYNIQIKPTQTKTKSNKFFVIEMPGWRGMCIRKGKSKTNANEFKMIFFVLLISLLNAFLFTLISLLCSTCTCGRAAFELIPSAPAELTTANLDWHDKDLDMINFVL